MKTIVNGVNLSYADEGSGVPLVFVHGFPLDRRTWQKQVDAFRSTHRVITPDLRGFGQSEPGQGVSTMSQFAGDVHGLIQQLRTEPVVLVGHSMGGYVALACYRQYPQLFRGLVLVATRAGSDTPEAAAGRRTNAEKVKADGTKIIIDAMAPKMLAPDNQNSETLAEVKGLMANATKEGVIGALLGMAERPDSTSMLSNITVPTLVITGADDVLIPPVESERMAQAIPNAQLKMIPRAGHLVAHEQASEFNHILKSWLQGLGGY